MQTRQREVILKQGEPKMMGIVNAKSMRKALETLLAQQTKRGNIELQFYTQGILNLYNKFHPVQEVQVQASQWKGKSSFSVLKKIDRLVIIKYQKSSKDEEPQEIRFEYKQDEIQKLIDTIKEFNLEYIPTDALSMVFSQKMGLGHDGWNTGEKQFFSDRHWHNRLTVLLNGIQEMGFIEYKGGKTKLIDKDLSIQLIL